MTAVVELKEGVTLITLLHSGSRGIGNIIGRHFIEKAKRQMEQYFITLPDSDLAYFPEDTDSFNAYVAAVEWAQDYALENRRAMMEAVLLVLRKLIPVQFTITHEAVNCHHNYVERENHFGKNLWRREGPIMTIRIIEDQPDLVLTRSEHERLSREYESMSRWSAAILPDFETWVRQQKAMLPLHTLFERKP